MTRRRTKTLWRWTFYDKPGPFLRDEEASSNPYHSKVRQYWPLFVFLAVTSVLMWVTNSLSSWIVVEPLATWTLDARLRRATKKQEVITRTVTVGPADHYGFFKGQSPLPAASIVEAVCAMSRNGAALVAVDLDTSSEAEFHNLKMPDFGIPVIWAADVLEQRREGTLKPTYVAIPPVGNRSPWPPHGVAAVLPGFDGVVRSWPRMVEAQGGAAESLPWAVVRGYCKDPAHAEACAKVDLTATEPDPLGFDVRFSVLPLNMFVPIGGSAESGAKPGGPDVPPTQCGKREVNPILADRIVFLGGTYSEGDRHYTPWGRKDGVHLHAMGVESAFRGTNRDRRVALGFKLLFKLLLAVIIAALYHWIRPIPAAMLTVLLLPAAVWLAGKVMFALGSYEISVVPFILGILLEQQVSLVERSHHRSFHSST